MEKYTLDDKHRTFLREQRIARKFSAEEVSEKLNHHKSWLGQIERGRLASIKKEDLDKLLSILLDVPMSIIIESNWADDFYASNFESKETDDSIWNKITDTVDAILPTQYNRTSSYIKGTMKQITNIFCSEQSNSESQFINTKVGLGRFHCSTVENSNYSLLFLSLPMDAIFKKYKNNPEVILEIYDHIKLYIESKLSDETI